MRKSVLSITALTLKINIHATSATRDNKPALDTAAKGKAAALAQSLKTVLNTQEQSTK